MTKKLRALLLQMEQAGQAERLAVSECLQAIASNGGESGTDSHLLACAENVRDAAQEIVDAMRPKKGPVIKLCHFESPAAARAFIFFELLAYLRDDLDRMNGPDRQDYCNADRQDITDKIRDIEAVKDFIVWQIHEGKKS